MDCVILLSLLKWLTFCIKFVSLIFFVFGEQIKFIASIIQEIFLPIFLLYQLFVKFKKNFFMKYNFSHSWIIFKFNWLKTEMDQMIIRKLEARGNHMQKNCSFPLHNYCVTLVTCGQVLYILLTLISFQNFNQVNFLWISSNGTTKANCNRFCWGWYVWSGYEFLWLGINGAIFHYLVK